MDRDWIEKQREYQLTTYGFDPPSEPVDYFRDMTWALFVEVGELCQAVPAKPWQDDRDMTVRERYDAIEELVDCLFFCANIAAWLGVPTDELRQRYADKMNTNIHRQEIRGTEYAE